MSGRLVSTRDKKRKDISYTDALLEGLAPDGGLYVPTEYPQVTLQDLAKLKDVPYHTLAFEVKKRLIGGTIPDADLEVLLENAYAPDKFNAPDGNVVPLRPMDDGLFIENLSRGPTAAFKDMALQQLGQEMNYELERRNGKMVILGATSGDTGSSAEAAVKGLERITLFMLSPLVGMSAFQKAQMGALTGDNIFNISIDGRFDDCQDLVKELKQDPEFAKLGAVNSINWGRISSQVPYFVSGYVQAAQKIGEEVDFVVPTGNFGNVLSGYIAKRMGVPIRRLIVATNENKVMATVIRTGIYTKTPAQVTSSPSMDISKASNYERLVYDILDRNTQAVSEYMTEFARTGSVAIAKFGVDADVFAQAGFFQGSSTHQDRLSAIRDVYEKTGTVIDPHTADAVTVARQYQNGDGVPMVVMETALPVKFESTITEALGSAPQREERFRRLENNVTSNAFHTMKPDAQKLKEYIRQHI